MFPSLVYHPILLGIGVRAPRSRPRHFEPPLKVGAGEPLARRAWIRTATADDFSAVRRLLQECRLPLYDLEPAHMRHFLVCSAESGLVGCAGLLLTGRVALLRALAVVDGVRRQGIGARLLVAAEEYAAEQGCEKVYVLTTTAEGYFRRCGYARLASTPLRPTTRHNAPASSPGTSRATPKDETFVMCLEKSLDSTPPAGQEIPNIKIARFPPER